MDAIVTFQPSLEQSRPDVQPVCCHTFWFPIHSLPLESENLGPESKCSILYYLKCKNKQVFNSLEEKDVYTMCTRSQRFLRKRQARDVCKWKLFLFVLNNAKPGVWRPGETVNCGVFTWNTIPPVFRAISSLTQWRSCLELLFYSDLFRLGETWERHAENPVFIRGSFHVHTPKTLALKL